MSDSSDTPWWFSGNELPEGESSSESSSEATSESTSESSSASIDWMGLLAGATRMVDWAASAVVEPHGEHADPAAHPDCLVCRTLVLVQDRSGMQAPRPDSPAAADPSRPAEPIRWIPVRDHRFLDE
ncbi:MAG: hypothetical protein WAO50_12820 [Candidatus Nanopelagicales bacterium]|nr:hypothetical protein [Candidatus Nanopelagicales bacterium]MCF8538083.1 hypothetical protein [Candidatus Nanopelagicales bacterium]MCF8543608.1 hypothetical protein [Candidatus Nanopelagicales bacterium]MCF8557177.1 hypothetical protein [Candidatus Nanopelagicales bacterium]